MKDPIHVMLHQIRPRRLLLIFASTITLVLAIQVFLIPFRIASFPFSVHDSHEIEEESLPVKNAAYTKAFAFGKFSLLTKSLNVSDTSAVGLDRKDKTEVIGDVMEEEEDVDDIFNLGENEEPDNELLVNETSNIAEMKVAEKENNATFLLTGNQTILHEKVGATKKKKKVIVPTPVYISEMNEILLKNHAAYHAMRPRWYSARDKELLAAKAQIEHAPPVKNVQGLHAPAFRNISKFIRSYELMEKMLKVYVYKEGQKPIFHQPLRRGIYASEGWFMQLMESSKQFKAKDPRKAHLFYIPFSSRLLQFALYVRNSHNRRNLEQFMVDYVNTIAAKYPYWNRTGGSDHFVAACHDWALYETRRAMEKSIRALCVADLHLKFRIGRDVSLPETYIISAKNPQRNIGGLPASNRSILAFYAGNMHGNLRTILLKHWENKDPDMKILGPMPKGISRKMNYMEHMKNSKYCICPKGYEVNSPRIVESFFYECVPVIISDNYVPPFFEVLNWEAFSVIIPEKDVWRLREILDSIPEEKYLLLQEGVRKVQQHFLWHSKPVKYDLFHMTLHSIWYNRVYNVRTR